MKPSSKPNLETQVALLNQFNEQWLPIANYENLYEVSNFGRVRSLDRTVRHKRIGTQFVRGQIIKQSQNRYCRVTLAKNGIQKPFSVHRLVATAFIQNIDNKPVVNHIDGDKLNNVVSNLEWLTWSENTIHAFNTGLTVVRKGELSHASKLSMKDVEEIRRRVKLGEMKKELAKEFGVCRGNITAIIQRRSWV